MSKLEKYHKLESWVRQGENFSVEIVHWTLGEANKWNVYARISEKHPLFPEFILEDYNYYQPATDKLPLHGGCTYFQVTQSVSDPEAKLVKAGSDYIHYGDEEFELATKPHPITINDAVELYEFLRTYKAKEVA